MSGEESSPLRFVAKDREGEPSTLQSNAQVFVYTGVKELDVLVGEAVVRTVDVRLLSGD